MLKKDIRKQFKEKRAALSSSQLLKFNDLVLIQFQTLHLPQVSRVLTYAAMEEQGEIAAEPLIDYLSFRQPNLEVAYPVCDFEHHHFDAVLIHEDTAFLQNKYGTFEPVDGPVCAPDAIDMVLVPLLAFDTKGHRVGYGKGFYDRFLEKAGNNCIKVGLSYFDPVDIIEDIHPFDVSLDYCVTPQQIYEF